jgi:hypothetical protein
MTIRPRCSAWRTPRAEPVEANRRSLWSTPRWAKFSQVGVRTVHAPMFTWRMLNGRTRARTPQEGRALQASGEHPDFRIQQCRPHPCRIGRTARARCSAPRAAIERRQVGATARQGGQWLATLEHSLLRLQRHWRRGSRYPQKKAKECGGGLRLWSKRRRRRDCAAFGAEAECRDRVRFWE